MRTRFLAAGVGGAIALAAAGCGGGGGGSNAGGGGTPAGADFVPRDAVAFVLANTDFGGDQWKKLEDLANKFPSKQRLLDRVRAQLQKKGLDFDKDVKPALGPETDIGLISATGSGQAVVVTKPGDPSKTEALEAKVASDPAKAKHEVVDGWYVASDTQASIDAAKTAHSGDSLAKSDGFKTAMGDLPSDALAKFYVDGATLTNLIKQRSTRLQSIGSLGSLQSIAGDLDATSDGIGLHAIVRSTSKALTDTYSSELVSEVPAGALLYLSFDHLDKAVDQIASSAALKTYTGLLQAVLGISVQDIADLFAGEGALYVRPGSPIPEVTLVVKESDEQKASSTADKLVAALVQGLGGRVSAPTSETVDGVSAKKIAIGTNFAVYYAVFGGKLVLTDSPTGISGLKDGGAKLADDSVFKEAQASASMPGKTAGFVYVNLKDGIPVVENFAQIAGQALPSDVTQNLQPLRTLLLYTSRSGDKLSTTGFLEIK